ncbi:hypothetical protein HOQ23_08765 [Nocardioides sp. zg-DK7169]|nr:hypothetical protein [Nocardioides sp. zg-DK7169]
MAPVTRPARAPWERTVVAAVYLVGAGVHVGIVASDPTTYAPFAGDALFGFVRTGWRDVFMDDPRLWGLQLAAGEALLGVLLLIGGRVAAVGWAGVLGFHVLLLLFGLWAWWYAVPALAVLTVLAARDRGWRLG